MALASTVVNAATAVPEYVSKNAYILAYYDFPKAVDIVAIAFIESTFRHDVVSNKAAIGVMQVIGGSKDPLLNMQSGVALLREYYLKLGSTSAAIQAYNIGIGNYTKGKRLDRGVYYLSKFNKGRKEYAKVTSSYIAGIGCHSCSIGVIHGR